MNNDFFTSWYSVLVFFIGGLWLFKTYLIDNKGVLENFKLWFAVIGAIIYAVALAIAKLTGKV